MDNLSEALRSLLQKGEASTQEELCAKLLELGFEMNQSKASRLLRKIGAIKVLNTRGEAVYSLPHDPAPPQMNISMREIVFDIKANEMMVVVRTSPGSASLIGRVIDHSTLDILGTIAGDDVIFVAPGHAANIQSLVAEIKELLRFS